MHTNTLRFAVAALAAAFLAGCDVGSTTDVGGVTIIPPEPPVTSTATVLDAEGNPMSSVSTTDPVQLRVSGLTPNERLEIVVTDPDGNEISPPGGYTIQADEDGVMPTSTVVQNLDLVSPTPRGSGEPAKLMSKRAQTGRYNIQVRRPGGQVVGQASFNVSDDSRLFCADSSGEPQGSFTTADTVFVKIERGGGDLEDGTYDLYVFSDLNAVLREDDGLGGNSREITVAGGMALIEIGRFNAGVWDVILDVDRNGEFDPRVDLVSRRPRHNPCFTIQQARSEEPVPIVGQICSDAMGNYRDVFDPTIGDPDNRDMFAFITPNRRPRGGDVLAVRKYVVAHQDTWAQGDPLVDVTAGFEVDPVQGFCTNEAPWLVWPRQLFEPGCYDVIIDVNRNAVYDVGIDFLDNIDNRGQVSCGCRIPDTDCSDRIQITSPEAGATIEATTAQLAGSVTGTPVRGYATIVSRAQSNRVDLSVATNGSFSGRIPLFRGDNLITVTFEYEDGTACSLSISVNSNPPVASTLFRVQLTWDGDTDSDLHLVRPHTSGGDLFDQSNDCYYSNCIVGFEGLGSNSIDWGLPGEDDDPKQDTDCVSCGVGIENTIMNQINEDGDYVIYVDQFSGTEDNLVTVFIRDVQVGQVSCQGQSRGTNTGVCRVGTISWSGLSQGTGTFTPDGILGPRSQFSAAQAKSIPAK